MTEDEIRREVDRLAKLSAFPGCPAGGWQYPVDFGNGIVAPAYGDTQKLLHPWRRDVLIRNLLGIYGDRLKDLSVLDLGSCEGGIALGLWEQGVRNITCVEGRAINVAKARFVNEVKGMGLNIIHSDVTAFLQAAQESYDVVLFMGLLYHVLDPFLISGLVAKVTREVAVYETALALPTNITFANDKDYSPTPGGFFVRLDSKKSNTAGFSDFELWPTKLALLYLLEAGGYTKVDELDYGPEPNEWYATGQRAMIFAHK